METYTLGHKHGELSDLQITDPSKLSRDLKERTNPETACSSYQHGGSFFSAGNYVVELEANPSFAAVSVFAIIPETIIATDLTFNETYNMTFEAPEGKIHRITIQLC